MKRVPLEVQLAFYVLVTLAIMMVTGLAADPSAQAPERPRTACAADYKQFCAGTKPGEGRVAQCMREHAAELSAQCKASLQSAEAARDSRRSGKAVR